MAAPTAALLVLLTAASMAVPWGDATVEPMVASTGRRMAGVTVGTKAADSAVDWAETRAAQRGDAKVEHLAERWADVKAGTMAAELVPR
jgi:hypothetical protein